MGYDLLKKSYKRMFPFRVGTTSYIYPDSIVPNVSKLAPFLDEIELVLFESGGQDNYPDEAELETLMNFSLKSEATFNIHLPIDIFLADKNEKVRLGGISVVEKVIEKTFCVKPSLYTLHFDMRDRKEWDGIDVEALRSRVSQSAEEMKERGINLERIAIETLSYPFEWIEDILKEFGFSICLDIGHMLLYGLDVRNYLKKYLPRTSIIHLHGVQNGIDHLGIDKLDGRMVSLILSELQRFTGILSIEVFTFADLKNSLEVLEQQWKRK